MQEQLFTTFFHHAPPGLDVDAIRAQWSALRSPYDVRQWVLPLPLWAKRPYDDSGAQAWGQLRQELTHAGDDKPFCLYLHTPFCASKCHFCDCYSFKLGAYQEQHIQRYVDQLCAELRLWSQQGNLHRRPVSTVHLGGGTPTFIGAAALEQVATCCRDCFAVSDATEWALESTVADLTPTMIRVMADLGFRRLHLGVQSLQPDIRAAIGRRRPSAAVLQRIADTLALGWVVSVDMVCGLPGQTLAGWVADLRTLLAAGVDGVSLYELLVYPQNQKWAAQQGLTQPDRHVTNYLLFQAGAALLAAHGFGKNLFNHWANGRDANVYFTFPTRHEDCLAVGTIGDGVFGQYHYRHGRYADYLRADMTQQPGLEGGLRRTAVENALQPLTTAVLAGTIPLTLRPALQHLTARGVTRQEQWQSAALITPGASGGFTLTPNGAWFAGNMLGDMLVV